VQTVDNMTHTWDPQQKPPGSICPKRYCLCWIDKGDLHRTPEGTFVASEQERCGCLFGKCTRLYPEDGDADWYEPCEPYLEKDGLPWFYFIPNPAVVVDEVREEYTRQSEALWGKEHWKTSEGAG
jgi:hypothetical protein